MATAQQGRERSASWTKASSSLASVSVVLAVIVVWQIVVSVFHISEVILPSPIVVIQEIAADWKDLLTNSLPTLEEVLLGYLLSVVVAVPLGIVLAVNKRISQAVFPLVVGAQTIPKVAVAPLFVLWLGFGIVPKVLITFFVAFFPIVVDIASGISSVPSEMTDLGRVLKLGSWGMLRRIQIPYALPQTFSGLKVAMTLGVIGAIVGEFVGANAGLGYLLVASNGNFNTPLMFAALVVLTFWGVVLYMAVEVLERLAIPWHVSQRH